MVHLTPLLAFKAKTGQVGNHRKEPLRVGEQNSEHYEYMRDGTSHHQSFSPLAPKMAFGAQIIHWTPCAQNLA